MARPNFLIFMSDHQRGDTVLPGHPAVTPHVDRLAREGVSFTQVYCPTPHCSPAKATFHTGLYPSRHGVWNNVGGGQALSRGLKPGVRLWSEDLRDAGYELAFCGSWHVSAVESPADRGWREAGVLGSKPSAANDESRLQSRRSGIGDLWTRYRKLAEQPEPSRRGEGQILRPGYGTYTTYGTSEWNLFDEPITSAALEVLAALAACGKPWMLFMGIISPHDPYFAPRRFLDLYDPADVPLPPSYADTLADKPRIYKRMRDMRWGQLTPREVREAIRHYWALCSYADELFGRMLAALDAAGQADNTVVLYTSDHGDYCGDHGLFCKGIPCFRGAYHVPGVVRWPAGVAKAGRQVDAFVSHADWGPTLLELAGVSVDRPFSGRSLAPMLRDEPVNDWRDEIHTQCNGVELYYTQRSVTTRRWKYVFNGFDDDELYDLSADPHEMRNLAGDAAPAGVVRDMARRMWRFACREGDTAVNDYVTVALAPYGPAEAFRR